jgi:hypothetical protein
VPLGLSARRWHDFASLLYLLLAGFIHAHQWPLRILQSLIDFQDILHRTHKLGIGLRWNAPLVF